MRVCPVCRSRFPAGSNFCPHDGHKLEDLDATAPHHDPLLGTVLDRRYKLEARLGSGGMGDVYAARHIVIDKPVAIKILRKEYSDDPRQAERFIREARAASLIKHPNIVDVTDFGRLESGQIYFVMEFLVGITLGKELRLRGALTTRRTLSLSIQTCHALEAAHSKGIVHRDLKPENIFIVNPITGELDDEAAGRQQDIIKLLDFGIAKMTWDEQGRRLTKVGSIFGTPQYMCPEQASGKDTDHRGDIYGLGCIVYEMLTGEVPFLADTFMGTLTKQMFESPVPPRQLRPDLGIPEPVEQVILRAMEKDAEARYQSMTELAGALEACFRACEAGPIRRSTANVVVVQGEEGVSAIEEITDKDRETVHLLVQPRAPDRVTRRPARLWPVVGAVALFLTLSGVGAYLVLRGEGAAGIPDGVSAARPEGDGRSSSGGRVTVERADGKTAAIRADAARPPGRPGTVTIVLRSVPKGALVYENGRLVGPSPQQVTVPAHERRRFVFRLAGYQQEVLHTSPQGDETHLIRLQRAPVRQPTTQQERTPYGSTSDLRNPFKGRPSPKR
jgi:serine/threonine protein kinase